MKIYLDVATDTTFFITVPVNADETETISFDNTLKGKRITKQVYRGKNESSQAIQSKPDMEWDTLIFEDGLFVGKEHVVWYDKGSRDIVDGEIWDTIFEKPLSDDLAQKIQALSNSLRDDNQDHDTCSELEILLKDEIKNV